MSSIDAQMRSVNSAITSNIDRLEDDRELLSLNIMSQLRTLVESVAVRAVHKDGSDSYEWGEIGPALERVRGDGHLNFLTRFHKLLQISASHYTLEGDPSARLMLKYYEYLVRIRDLVETRFGMQILDNLERFPLDTDPSLREYHEKIAARIDAKPPASTPPRRRDRYYIRGVKPFFISGNIYYEVTFSSVTNRMSKSDRLIGFTDIDVTDKYAASLDLTQEWIDVLGQQMPVTVIRDWEVSIRPCEFEYFGRIFDIHGSVSSKSTEYRSLMHHLTTTRSSLLDLIDLDDHQYERVRRAVAEQVKKVHLLTMLDAARTIIRSNAAGSNVLRYLLLRMHNQTIKDQYYNEPARILSGLHLSRGCKPFDEMPFCTSPLRHNPRLTDLLECLSTEGRIHELLARRVKTNTESRAVLYTPEAELEDLGPVDELIATYNSKLYFRHTGRRLIHDKGHVVESQYEESTVAIIEKLQAYATSGLVGHEAAIGRWLNETSLNIDDKTKVSALRQLFARSRVAMIYGAAGTGKSTMVNYIANYLSDNRKLFLAQTNPAVDNLKRKVQTQNAEFRTIASHTSRTGMDAPYDVLVIDECSTVSNADLLKVLERTPAHLVVLVGDVFQIEAIRFGNWFSTVRSFIPKSSVFELVNPYRTRSPELLAFWTSVRNLDADIAERMTRGNYAAKLSEELFRARATDEIILCLNYDGLYGINNANRFLQASNTGKSITRGASTYKVGDPVLFTDTYRFHPVLFNNLKGVIVEVEEREDALTFTVEVDRGVTELDVWGTELRLVADSTVQFEVYDRGSTDEDDETNNTAVPFQIAYAVSIHRAQGLEYDSVKVVITDANEDDVTHNIFYTAVTRARESLQVFWSPETQQNVLDSLSRRVNSRDIALLKVRTGVRPSS